MLLYGTPMTSLRPTATAHLTHNQQKQQQLQQQQQHAQLPNAVPLHLLGDSANDASSPITQVLVNSRFFASARVE
jgi:hypothetical protein